MGQKMYLICTITDIAEPLQETCLFSFSFGVLARHHVNNRSKASCCSSTRHAGEGGRGGRSLPLQLQLRPKSLVSVPSRSWAPRTKDTKEAARLSAAPLLPWPRGLSSVGQEHSQGLASRVGYPPAAPSPMQGPKPREHIFPKAPLKARSSSQQWCEKQFIL